MGRRDAVSSLCLVVLLGCGDNEQGRVFPEGGYARLSETGYFAGPDSPEIAPDLVPFTVAYPLWSDGAEKERHLRLPPGTEIDTSDADHWTLPVGAQAFKSFVKDGVLVETRLIERIDDTGDRDDDYWVGAFVWRDDERDADFAPDGAVDARGTDHDVPGVKDCWRCHRGQPGVVLGLGAIQSGERAPPGEGAVQAALGYLHANCSHCHNPRGSARIDTDMDLELAVGDGSPEETKAYETTIGVELQYWIVAQDEFRYRVVAGDPAASGLLHRMTLRDTMTSMPPLASELVHEEGVATVEAWIAGL